MKIVALQKVAIGYDEPADSDRPDGPKRVVVYDKGDEIQEPVDNLIGLVDQGYVEMILQDGIDGEVR